LKRSVSFQNKALNQARQGLDKLSLCSGSYLIGQGCWVIVGGMSLGTLQTVFVVPTMYTLLARQHAPVPNKEPTFVPVAE
jgi:hypothetical protein